jgi:hypothetical protein
MVELIHLVNDISTPLKLGWVGVLVWSAVQVMWYRHGRIVPGEAQPVSGAWSAARLFAALTRSADVSETAAPGRSPLSIAPARQPASEVETPSAASDHASDMWETVDADWFDEALRMSEMRGGSKGHPAGSPRIAGDFTPDASQARQ